MLESGRIAQEMGKAPTPIKMAEYKKAYGRVVIFNMQRYPLLQPQELVQLKPVSAAILSYAN